MTSSIRTVNFVRTWVQYWSKNSNSSLGHVVCDGYAYERVLAVSGPFKEEKRAVYDRDEQEAYRMRLKEATGGVITGCSLV